MGPVGNLGDIRGAKADFSTAVRLNPVFTSGFHYRAITESRTGDYDQALKDLERAIELRPGSSGLYFTRGVTYFLSRQFERAVSDFESEFTMSMINKKLNPNLDTMFLCAEEKYMYLSSSAVKELGIYDVELSDFLPSEVIEDFKARLNARR